MGDPATYADAAHLWHQLIEHGWCADLYADGNPALGVNASVLRQLLGDLDETQSVGATLGICVQATAALPLLAAAADRDSHAAQPLRAATEAVLAGREMVALAATDVTPGTDLMSLTTEVQISGDRLSLTGAKQWVTNAGHSSHLLVLARHRAGAGFANFTWVAVPTDSPGVTVSAAPTSLFDGSGTAHVTFRHVSLPLAYIAGGVGRGLVDFARHISVERLGSGVWALAMCRRVIRQTIDYLRGRGVGAANLWSRENVRQEIARCLLATDALEAQLDRYQDTIVSKRDSLGAAVVKATAAETVETVLSATSHLQGAHAFVDDGLHHLRAQAGLWSVGGGTYEVMLSAIADQADKLLSRT